VTEISKLEQVMGESIELPRLTMYLLGVLQSDLFHRCSPESRPSFNYNVPEGTGHALFMTPKAALHLLQLPWESDGNDDSPNDEKGSDQ